MGTWGNGNLDNDCAWDELSDRSHELVTALLDRARMPESRQADEYDYTTLFVEFEILFALDSKGLISGVKLPQPCEVEELKWSYIDDWTSYIDGLKPTADHKRLRRMAILRTFNRFKQICAKHHGK
jgi:hypothetical protein